MRNKDDKARASIAPPAASLAVGRRRYPLIGSEANMIACRLRILKRNGSAGYQEAVARQLAPLAGGSDSFAVRFWMRDSAPAYRRELERFGGELAGGPRSLFED